MSDDPDVDLADGGDGPGWRLFLAGDCVLDEDRDRAPVGEALRERIGASDLALANLEAPVPVDDEPIPKVGPALTTAAETPAWLADAGFDLLALANNHTMDYGEAGLDATREACRAAGVGTCGAGSDRAAALEPARVAVDGVDVAVVDVCEREFGVATRTGAGTAPAGHRGAVAAVREAAADAVVVVSHGGVEYVPLPPRRRRDRLREFAEAGADLVVGHHPHVPQGWEVYDGVPVFPSLGNFAFDRQADDRNTARSLALDVRFAGGTVTDIDLVPTVLDGTVGPLPDREEAEFREYLADASRVLREDRAYESHWQTVACRLFYERYSDWLLTGTGETLTRARADPNDPDAQRPHWDPERRRQELLVLLNIIRNESHCDTMATALGVFGGDLPDRRTDRTEAAVEDLLAWTRRD